MNNLSRSAAVAVIAFSGPALASSGDAPLFQRPFDGVPVPRGDDFGRVLPPQSQPTRALQPANLPTRFSESLTTPSSTGMDAGFAYFGQFVDHDLDLSPEDEAEFLLPPFVPRLELDEDGSLHNLRTPGFDLDSVYGFGPLSGFSFDEGWFDLDSGTGLKFKFGDGPAGNLDHLRDPQSGRALIGDFRNDENGLIRQVHLAFMQLHNVKVDQILERDGVDPEALVPGEQDWWDVFNEARNYTIAYYQGIVANEFARHLTGRTLFEALADDVHPLGVLDEPAIPLEFAQAAYRLHTIVPAAIQIDPHTFVSPIDDVLRESVNWKYLFGPYAVPAGRIDSAVPAALRDIVSLAVPGVGEINLDLAQVNILRGREVGLGSGEDYLAALRAELGLPSNAPQIRGKLALTPTTGATFLDPVEDAEVLADLSAGVTDVWAYIMLEAELNGGLLGPVGQDIIEKTWLTLLLDDPYSLLGEFSDQYTPAQMQVFRNATIQGLLDEITLEGDLDKDAVVTTTDLALFLGLWNSDEIAADFNNDGFIDSQDLAILLGNWGRDRR